MEKVNSQEDLNKVLDSLDNRAYTMIRDWLFDKANSFAPDEKALHLHRTCNALIPVIEELDPRYEVFQG